jgi:hypothetical protein
VKRREEKRRGREGEGGLSLSLSLSLSVLTDSCLQIQEILDTGHLRRADFTDEHTQTFELFSKIWGAGPGMVFHPSLS